MMFIRTLVCLVVCWTVSRSAPVMQQLDKKTVVRTPSVNNAPPMKHRHRPEKVLRDYIGMLWVPDPEHTLYQSSLSYRPGYDDYYDYYKYDPNGDFYEQQDQWKRPGRDVAKTGDVGPTWYYYGDQDLFPEKRQKADDTRTPTDKRVDGKRYFGSVLGGGGWSNYPSSNMNNYNSKSYYDSYYYRNKQKQKQDKYYDDYYDDYYYDSSEDYYDDYEDSDERK